MRIRNGIPHLLLVAAVGVACGPRDTTPETPRVEMGDAIEMIERGDYVAAEPALERILRDRRGPPDELHHYLGVCAQAREDWADAETHYREALRRTSGLFESRLNLGNVVHYQGREDEALAILTNLTEGFPEEPDGFFALGLQQQEMGLLEEALVTFRRVVELVPGDDLAWMQAGEVLRALGRSDDRIVLLEQGGEATDHAATVAIELAHALAEAGRTDEAVVTLVEASGSPVNDANLVGALAFELRDMNRIDEALTVADAGIDRAASDEEFRRAVLAAALIARQAGRDEAAEAVLRRGLGRLSGERSMSLFLGRLLVEAGRCDEAVPLLRVALETAEREDAAGRFAAEAREALAACGATGDGG